MIRLATRVCQKTLSRKYRECCCSNAGRICPKMTNFPNKFYRNCCNSKGNEQNLGEKGGNVWYIPKRWHHNDCCLALFPRNSLLKALNSTHFTTVLTFQFAQAVTTATDQINVQWTFNYKSSFKLETIQDARNITLRYSIPIKKKADAARTRETQPKNVVMETI